MKQKYKEVFDYFTTQDIDDLNNSLEEFSGLSEDTKRVVFHHIREAYTQGYCIGSGEDRIIIEGQKDESK